MKTVLITGASSDIGLATSRRYLAAGWRVIGAVHEGAAEVQVDGAPWTGATPGWQHFAH